MQSWLKQGLLLTMAAYSWPAVLAQLKRDFDGHGELGLVMLDGLRNADVAFIDDLGAERMTDSNRDWILRELYVVIDQRYANPGCRTLVSSNLSPAQLERQVEDRIGRRLGEMCQPIELKRRK